MKNLDDIDFEKVYTAQYSKLKRFSKEYVLVEEDAEDIVHNVFLDLWEKKEIIKLPINLNAFLYAVTKNKCLNHLKHKKVIWDTTSKMEEEQRIALQMKFESLKVLDEGIFAEGDIELIIEKAVASLPEKCREIFIKSRLEGKKHKVIADELRISTHTVEAQMNIAYKKMRIALKDYFGLILFLGL
jgi:RNA polymerase sigma-70 factor (ECF subfamily)